jgi:hypothetical protein
VLKETLKLKQTDSLGDSDSVIIRDHVRDPQGSRPCLSVVEINDGHLRRESRLIHSFLILKSKQTTLRRIHREISDLKKEDLGEISVGPVANDNPFLWRARIPGPEGSVYEGGMFNVEIILNHDYPCVLLSL